MYNHDEDDNGKIKSLFCFPERDTAAIVITSIQVKMTLKTTIFIFVECSDKRIVIHITKKFNPFLFMCVFIYVCDDDETWHIPLFRICYSY